MSADTANRIECGYTIDHDEVAVYEDEDRVDFYCRRCGVEWSEGVS